MPIIKFPSPFIKMGTNTEHGDVIKFKDAGIFDEKKKQWIFTVSIFRNGVFLEDKLFGLNKGNYDAIVLQYGNDSDTWVGKEMEINRIKSRNPQTGQPVDSILLTAVVKLPEGI